MGPGCTRGALQIASGTVWLLFIAFPLTGNLAADRPSWRHVLAVAGAALFIAAYLGIIACWPGSFWAQHDWMRWALYGVLLAVSARLTPGVRVGLPVNLLRRLYNSGRGFPDEFWLILLCVTLALGGTLASGQGSEDALAYGAAIDPSAEAVLAWVVREGAPDVIRHSKARSCLFRVPTAWFGGARVEVLDDGPPSASLNGSDGHGLDRLRERVGGINGTVSAGPRAGGGYRLAVEVPAPAGAGRA